jgi:hypothetical protein
MTDDKTSNYKDISTQGHPLRFVGEWTKLAEALAKAQAEFVSLRKADTVNTGKYSFTFADMDEHIVASRPALTKHGISVLQMVHDGQDGQESLTTIIMGHGGRIEARWSYRPAKDIKEHGGLLTYIARYAYNKALGLGGGEDADHNTQPIERTARKPAARAQSIQDAHRRADRALDPFDEPGERMSRAQAKQVGSLIRALDIPEGEVLTMLEQQAGTSDKKAITADGAEKVIQYLRNLQAEADVMDGGQS